MFIREANPDDAGDIITLFQQLYSETTFLLYEPGEFVPRVNEYAHRIGQTAKDENGVMFIAEADRGMVGIIFGNRGTAKKTRHSLFVVMGVLRSHWNQGVGRSLLAAVERWATAHGLHRLELTVQTRNAVAIALYEKSGFVSEGVKRHSLRSGTQFIDEMLMSKLIAA